MQNTRMLFLITTIVVVFIGSNVGARPVVSWEPADIEIQQMQGTQSIHTIILKSTEDLKDIKVYVAPKLKPWVSISPANIELITKDSNYELTLTIDVAPNATVGKYKGAVLIQP